MRGSEHERPGPCSLLVAIHEEHCLACQRGICSLCFGVEKCACKLCLLKASSLACTRQPHACTRQTHACARQPHQQTIAPCPLLSLSLPLSPLSLSLFRSLFLSLSFSLSIFLSLSFSVFPNYKKVSQTSCLEDQSHIPDIFRISQTSVQTITKTKDRRTV